MVIIYLVYLVLFVLIGVFGIICMKIKSSGMNVGDFFRFVVAVGDLDALYNYSVRAEDMTKKEQIAFLKSAEKMFDAFEKVPSIIWEDEYDKYSEVLERYQNIKVLRWSEAKV